MQPLAPLVPPVPPAPLPAPTAGPAWQPPVLLPGDAAAFAQAPPQPGVTPPPPASTNRAASLVIDFRGLASLYNAIATGLKAPRLSSLSGALRGAMPLMQRAAAVQAVASGVAAGVDLMEGRITGATALSRVTNETLGAFVGGGGAALTAGLLVGAFSATGAMAVLLGVIGGLVGYEFGQSVLRATGIPGMIDRAIRGVFGR